MNTFAVIVLVVIFVVMAAYICWLTWMLRRSEAAHKSTRETSSRLIANLHAKTSVQAYEALEQGMDEQQESYEQEYLTWQEKEFDYMWTLAHVMNENYDLRYERTVDLAQIKMVLDTEGFTEGIAKVQEQLGGQE